MRHTHQIPVSLALHLLGEIRDVLAIVERGKPARKAEDARHRSALVLFL
jgi:hypothetical protein